MEAGVKQNGRSRFWDFAMHFRARRRQLWNYAIVGGKSHLNNSRRVLHASQPLSYGSRIKSHTSPDPERWYPSGSGLLEDRDPRHGKELREFLSGQCAADLLDLICDAHI